MNTGFSTMAPRQFSGGKKTLFSGAGLMDEVGPPHSISKRNLKWVKGFFFNVRVNTIKLLDTKSLCP